MRQEHFPRLRVPQTLAHPRWSLSKYGGDGSNEALARGRCLGWMFGSSMGFLTDPDKDVLYQFARRDSQSRERQVVFFKAT